MKKFISFSGGVESTTMCLLYGKGAKAIFADTGAEHAELYKRLDYVRGLLVDFHNGDFDIIRIKAKTKIHDKRIDNLTDYIKESKYFPSRMQRFCTRIFKIEPIDLFLKSQGECELMIGLNYDEQDMRTGNYGLQSNVKYSYPLIENKITRDDCIDKLDHYGLLPNFMPYMSRGGCKYCFFKSKKEYAAMVHLASEEIQEVMELEEYIQEHRNKYFRIRDNMPPLRDFISKEKNNLFGDSIKDYYSYDEKSVSCGVFCHR